MKKKNHLSLLWKIPLGIILSIIILLLLIFVSFNLLKYPIYSSYYGAMENLGTIPGLNNNFVPQGICVSEENNLYLFSGYTSSNLASRVYAKDENGIRKYEAYQNNTPFKGHLGGIACDDENVYLASDDHIFTVKLSLFLNNPGRIEIGRGIEVNNQASFVFTDDNYLYVGEFNDSKNYFTSHPVKVDENTTYMAICTKYSLDDLSTPIEIYSLPNKVQGFAIDENGGIMLSTSYGLANSNLYYYEQEGIVESDTIIDGLQVKILKDYSKHLITPPMSEDLDYSNGKFITLNESACNKYIFGKFFFATYYFGIDINKF